MRTTVTIETLSTTLSEAVEELTRKWRSLVNDEDAVLPTDAEMSLKTHPYDEDQYETQLVARIKIDTDDYVV